MDDRMRVLEDQLEASQATIEAQQEIMEAHGVNADVAQGTQLDEFLNSLEWGGHVQSTYAYNFNNPDAQAGSQALNQFNLNHNSFQLDAVKIELGKSADEPGSAGFQIDLLWGENAAILGTAAVGASDDFSHVQEAYVSYNWENIVLQAGKYETLLGYEVIDSPDNFNVTQGILFTWAIPLTHTGVLASGNFTEEIGWAFGVNNGFNNTVDTNDDKGAVGQLSYDSGSFFTSLSAYYSADGVATAGNTATVRALGTGLGTNGQVNNHDSTWILDLILQLVPQEGTTLWLNADYGETEDVLFPAGHNNSKAGTGRTEDAVWYGASVGAHHQISEKLDCAIRGEYFRDEEGVKLPVQDEDAEVWSLTGTLGYQLTRNLKTRIEGRYDRVNSDGPNSSAFNEIFPDGGRAGLLTSVSPPTPATGGGSDDELYAIWEIVYEFD